MSPDTPLLAAKSIEEEVTLLGLLWKECEAYLVKWKAYGFTVEESPADAFVAIFTLQKDIDARREYLFAKYVQQELPF